jgi:poly-gamma-glutamate capsule biosynthesis protein CapA/YwtB (metallophosphatase superfamily)
MIRELPNSIDIGGNMKIFATLVLLFGIVTGLYVEDKAFSRDTASEGENSVTLLLLGDINIQYRSDPADALRYVQKALNSADLVYGNLEGLLVKSEGPGKDIPDKGGWQHIGPEAVRALKAGNIRAVGLANNVAYGPDNIMATVAMLDANQIAHTGAGSNIDDAHKPAIVECKGVTIGFLQYTAKWYAQDRQIATASRPGVARIMSRDGVAIDASDLDRLRADIRRLRPLVDILVVSSHNRDGLGRPLPPELAAETRPLTTARESESDQSSLSSPIPLGPQFSQTEPYQTTLAHAAIDAGADIVYGHGSHVLQRIELYQGKPVLYCLGNFAMDWIRMSPNKEGMVAKVVIEKKRLARLSLVPVTRDAQNSVRMLDASSEDGAKLLKKVMDLSGGLTLKIARGEAILLGE